MRTIGIAITTYNRYQFTIDSFAQVLDDERISDIFITDDASTDDSYQKLQEYFKDVPKVKFYRNEFNHDCYVNKMRAMTNAWSDWNILLDSDNVIDKSYLDAIYAITEWDSKTIYQPSYARPHFDFRNYEGLTLTKENVVQFIDTHLMTCLNAANHFVNQEEYLKVWDGSVNPGSSDSIYFSYCWLNAGNDILITPELEYFHRIHDNGEGHFTQNQAKYVDFHNQLMGKIKQLR